jgi:FtsP/CotA-like multicopper oxidase with cupredoxin domain
MQNGQINGQKWVPDVPLSRNGDFQLDEEWNIGGSGAHPFHIHLYHMQVITHTFRLQNYPKQTGIHIARHSVSNSCTLGQCGSMDAC